MKHILFTIAIYSIAVILILFGVAHFFIPEVLQKFFPDFVPVSLQLLAIYLSGVVEIFLGVGMLMPKYRELSALLIFLMFIVYLPLHIRDIMIEDPVMRTQTGAIIRVIVQLLVIYLMWRIKEYSSSKRKYSRR